MAKLTKRAVEAARAEGTGWTWLGDDEVPGFGVRVYASGRRVYSLRYRTASGRQRMMKLGEHGELTVDAARKLAMKRKLQVLEGGDPLAEKARECAQIRTVGDLMTQWIEGHAKPHRKRWEEDKRRVDARILPTLGRLVLEDVTVDRLATWHRELGQNSPVEANRCLETLRAAWRWAERQGLLPDGAMDPTRRVSKYREKSRDRWLRKEELERLMEATRKEPDPYVRAAVPLLLLTGLRKRELLTARWENVDLGRGEIRLPDTKSGEAQVRLLPSHAVEILRELPREGSPFLFPSPVDGRKPRKDLKKPWERIREAAGLEDVTLHDLRRTAGSFMAQAGVPLQVIQHVLGHSHPGVTKLYARLASRNEREALETLGDEFSGILREAPDPKTEPSLRDRLALLLQDGEDPDTLASRLRVMADALEGKE